MFEKENLINAIIETLKNCNDIELLYLVLSMLSGAD